MKRWLAGALSVAGLVWGGGEALAADLVVYKSPTCGCCKKWIAHLEQNGFSVESRDVADMTAQKRQLGVPPGVESCHTAVTSSGYLIEGHVPAQDVRRLLAEKPDVKGLAVPGMPVGSPGMEVFGQRPDPYATVTFTRDGRTEIFANH